MASFSIKKKRIILFRGLFHLLSKLITLHHLFSFVVRYQQMSMLIFLSLITTYSTAKKRTGSSETREKITIKREKPREEVDIL